jgi:hypothetical protein
MRWASIWRVRGEGTDVHLVLDGGAPSPDGTRIQFWIVPWISGSFTAGGVPLERRGQVDRRLLGARWPPMTGQPL